MKIGTKKRKRKFSCSLPILSKHFFEDLEIKKKTTKKKKQTKKPEKKSSPKEQNLRTIDL